MSALFSNLVGRKWWQAYLSVVASCSTGVSRHWEGPALSPLSMECLQIWDVRNSSFPDLIETGRFSFEQAALEIAVPEPCRTVKVINSTLNCTWKLTGKPGQLLEYRCYVVQSPIYHYPAAAFSTHLSFQVVFKGNLCRPICQCLAVNWWRPEWLCIMSLNPGKFANMNTHAYFYVFIPHYAFGEGFFKKLILL